VIVLVAEHNVVDPVSVLFEGELEVSPILETRHERPPGFRRARNGKGTTNISEGSISQCQ